MVLAGGLLDFLPQGLIAGRVVIVGLVVMDMAGKPFPGGVVESLGFDLFQYLAEPAAKGFVVIFMPGETNDGERFRQQVLLKEMKDGRDELAAGQVTGGAEDDQGKRRRRVPCCRFGSYTIGNIHIIFSVLWLTRKPFYQENLQVQLIDDIVAWFIYITQRIPLGVPLTSLPSFGQG